MLPKQARYQLRNTPAIRRHKLRHSLTDAVSYYIGWPPPRQVRGGQPFGACQLY